MIGLLLTLGFNQHSTSATFIMAHQTATLSRISPAKVPLIKNMVRFTSVIMLLMAYVDFTRGYPLMAAIEVFGGLFMGAVAIFRANDQLLNARTAGTCLVGTFLSYIVTQLDDPMSTVWAPVLTVAIIFVLGGKNGMRWMAVCGAVMIARQLLYEKGLPWESFIQVLAASATCTMLAGYYERSQEFYQRELENRVIERTQQLSDANTKLEASLDKQRELDRLKTQFFDNVSHEFRTPLTLILLPLEQLLYDTSLPAAVREQIATMRRNANRLLRLINDLLDLAKISDGKARVRYEAVDLGVFLKSLVAPFEVLANRKNVELRIEHSVKEPIQTDPDLLDSILQNLISNALKFCDRGSITARTIELADAVTIEVADTGVGISSEDLATLFKRFAQAKDGIKRLGGTGIGLALVKERVELLGGQISVSSVPGSGSTFQVTLPKGVEHIREELRERRVEQAPVRVDRRSSAADPLYELHSAATAASSHAIEPAASSEQSASTLDHAGKDARTILIVEDHEDLRRHLQRSLSSTYHVLLAEDGERGLALATEKTPDVIISDVTMPKMSGLDMVRRIRAQPKTSDIPVVLLTSRSEVQDRIDGFQAGVNDYLTKPFSLGELFARIQNQLEAREREARSSTDERLRAIGMLSVGFAHEVRNPLNLLVNGIDPLKMTIEELQPKERVTEALQWVDDFDKNVRRLQAVAESLLKVGRDAQERISALDIHEVLDSVVKMVEWKLPPGISIKKEYGAQVKVPGSPGALSQVWLNLIDNALRAMGTQGTLTIATESDERNLRVSVQDTGHGISAEVLPRLFQPFVSTRPAGEGTGLGLSLCRRIVRNHRGEIQVQSPKCGGTIFKVSLPTITNDSGSSESIGVSERRPTVSG